MHSGESNERTAERVEGDDLLPAVARELSVDALVGLLRKLVAIARPTTSHAAQSAPPDPLEEQPLVVVTVVDDDPLGAGPFLQRPAPQ